MNLLLDTHAFLWWLQDSPRLGRRARALIGHSTTVVHVSAVSIWEIAIKAGKGKLKWKSTRALPSLAVAIPVCGFQELPISARDAAEVVALPLRHEDPFDRLLIAQAALASLSIVTADDAFTRYDVNVVSAVE